MFGMLCATFLGMKTTYLASWSTNNGNTFGSWTGTNVRKLRKELRAVCGSNLTGPRDAGRWSIMTWSEDSLPEVVACGEVQR